jgi:hypothetical protein
MAWEQVLAIHDPHVLQYGAARRFRRWPQLRVMAVVGPPHMFAPGLQFIDLQMTPAWPSVTPRSAMLTAQVAVDPIERLWHSLSFASH